MNPRDYWLKYTHWDEAPEDLRGIFLGLEVENLEDLIVLLASQLSRTSEYYGKYPVFSQGGGSNYPVTIPEIWGWLRTGEGLDPYHRPEDKRGIYRGDFESTERVPVQCMLVGNFVGSGLKTRGIPTRYRNILIERSNGNYGLHWILEYHDDEVWNPVDPKRLERGIDSVFMYAWQMVDALKEGKVEPEKIKDFLGTKRGGEVVAQSLLYDTLGLCGEGVVPWEVDVTYRGLDFNEAFEIYGYDRIVEDLYDVTKNPDLDSLRKVRDENIVGYKMR